jgi:5-methylthioadenosine/S-adenosylhomocysteine deaminase
MHIAEAPSETGYTLKNFQARPVTYLDRIDFLSPRVIAAHVVHVNDDEIQILKQREVGVSHCPQSNMKLASGVAPIPRMLRADLRIGLGTDGAASNNDLNLWEEMDTAAKLHKVITDDPTVVSARQALAMGTIGGARAIHMEDKIGSLEAKKYADVIIVDLDAPHLIPRYDIYSHLVYAVKASDVTDTIVNGRILMRDRRLLTLDEEKAKADAQRYGRQVRKSLKSDNR